MDWLSFFETMLDNIHEAIYILDRNRKFIFVNKSFIEILGSTRSELMHSSVYDMRGRGFFNLCLSDMVFEQKKEVTILQETVNVFHEHSIHINTCTPIFNEIGEIEFYIAVALPIEMLDWKQRKAADTKHQNQLIIKPKTKRFAGEIIAESKEFLKVLELANQVANSDASVLIYGETGTGKEIVARYIHQCSTRANKPFVDLNCASLPENLMEAELFGYLPGAFTGANPKGKVGLLEAADGGTLFLDEINSMPLSVQAKMLRAIETKTIMRLGAVKGTKVNFRVLASSNQKLQDCIAKGGFRADLFYRLNTFPIWIPPLRERKEDTEPLTQQFLEYYGKKYGREKRFSQSIMKFLKEYPWPGNVRELKNFVERMVVISASGVYEIKEIPPNVIEDCEEFQTAKQPNRNALQNDGNLFEEAAAEPVYRYDSGRSLKENLDAFERRIIVQAIKHNGSLSKAAIALGSSKATLSRKLKENQEANF